MRKLSVALVLAILWIPCHAQQESLLIGSGDMVHVRVFDTSELEETVRVDDAGQLRLVLGGMIDVRGLTPTRAAQAIEDRLKQKGYMLNPHVTVTVDLYATQNVSVLGQVRSPGGYSIATPRTIVEVLALAGGTTEAADRTLTIQRRGGGERVTYFVSNTPTEALDHNLLVYPGDVIIVPKAPVVYVLGDVGHSGGFIDGTNDGKLSVLQAISMAGGATPTAAVSHTRLIRKRADGSYVEMQLPLGEMLKGKKADIELQADDILYVPFSYMKNVAVGVGGIITAASSAAIYKF